MLILNDYKNQISKPQESLALSADCESIQLDIKENSKMEFQVKENQKLNLCFGFSESVTDFDLNIKLAKSSCVNVYRYGSEGKAFSHKFGASLAKDANLNVYEIFQSPKESKVNSIVKLEGEGANYTIQSFSNLDSVKLGHFGLVEHLAPNTFSTQNHRLCLSGDAHGTYEGDVYIEKMCSGVRANQLNQNLVLDPKAKVSTKPQLRIFHDDVKCAHGATITQPNQDQLFYLNSRGLSPLVASSLLKDSFKKVIFNAFENKDILHQMKDKCRV